MSKRPSGACGSCRTGAQIRLRLKARRWLLDALGPCLRPGIRHGADGVLESREGSLLGITAMIGCCVAALCPAAAGSLVPARVITPSGQRGMAEPAEAGGCRGTEVARSEFVLS
ncbi:hypothetical protein J3F84DRAFT_244299 [Trichoderma pleuroticola]